MKFIVRQCRQNTGRLFIETENDERLIAIVAPEPPFWKDRERIATVMCAALNDRAISILFHEAHGERQLI